MVGDGTLINDDRVMFEFFNNLRELSSYNFPPDHKFYVGDTVKIDGVIHMWDGQKWANMKTVYRV